jgi:dTDP-4-dehydrorhamnose reductase
MIHRILLFGSTGMLGTYISSYFHAISDIPLVKIDYRITNSDFSTLEDILVANRIDEHTCVINCIGLIPQRNASTDDNRYYLVNSHFPQVLSSICQKYGAKMIQPTTDCVFSGIREQGFYTEDDRHDESGHYGISKSLGEPSNCTVIRTSIIGRELHNKKSFLEWVLSNSENEISGWSNHYWNGITCLEYCKIIHEIIRKDIFWVGVRHIYSPTPASKYELACMIKDSFGMESMTVKNKTCENTVNKTLGSKYERIFEIKELNEQINDLNTFALI